MEGVQSLEVYNCHRIAFAVFYWPGLVRRSSADFWRGKQAPPLVGSSNWSLIAKGISDDGNRPIVFPRQSGDLLRPALSLEVIHWVPFGYWASQFFPFSD